MSTTQQATLLFKVFFWRWWFNLTSHLSAFAKVKVTSWTSKIGCLKNQHQRQFLSNRFERQLLIWFLLWFGHSLQLLVVTKSWMSWDKSQQNSWPCQKWYFYENLLRNWAIFPKIWSSGRPKQRHISTRKICFSSKSAKVRYLSPWDLSSRKNILTSQFLDQINVKT